MPKASLSPSRCSLLPPLLAYPTPNYSVGLAGELWPPSGNRGLVACGGPPQTEVQSPGALHSGDVILGFGVANWGLGNRQPGECTKTALSSCLLP